MGEESPLGVLNRVQLVAFRGDPDAGAFVHDVIFRNVSFAYSDAPGGGNGPSESWQHQAASGSDAAVTLEGVRRVSFEGCRVRHTGNYALRFNDGCTSNRVVNCTLEDLGEGGVWMGAGAGRVEKGETLSRRVIRRLVPRSTAFNLIDNCTIRKGGRFNPETKRLYIHLVNYPMGALPFDFADKVEYAQFLRDASELKIRKGAAIQHPQSGDLGGRDFLLLPMKKPNVEIPVVEIFLKK